MFTIALRAIANKGSSFGLEYGKHYYMDVYLDPIIICESDD
jgi:hypothetical protein